MKEANLISILGAFKKLDTNLFQLYLDYYSIKIKNDELKDLEILVNNLKQLSENANVFDKYFIGYTIPQISKEFDLLRIGEKSVVNIELKKEGSHDKVKKQLLRNKYYLSFLKRKIYAFTFVSEGKKLYKTDDDGNLLESNMEELFQTLAFQEVKKIKEIDSHFNPSNYLVSPFNSTLEFVRGEYFLTGRQEEIKHTVLNELNNPNYSILSIKGKAGTGKTLLTYDIAKEVSLDKEVLIVHCGYLNDGHMMLRNNYGWHIIPAKNLYNTNLSIYHLIIVDEAQRVYPAQLNHIISETKKNFKNCIFSYDAQQILSWRESSRNIEEQIEKEITFIKPFELTNKVRTNKEVASFILCLFNKGRDLENFKYSNIELNYFDNYRESKSFLTQLQAEDWKTINYTPSQYNTHPYERHSIESESDNAHTVIGQEYDNVVAVIDEYFCYKNNELTVKGDNYYYDPTKMLLQIVSRTRIKLNIVIIDNQEVLDRCLSILNR